MKTLLLMAGLLGFAAASAAQDITLFEDDNFGGQSFSANGSIEDLSRVNFNDRASSVIVRNGSWQLCADSFFRGRCITLNTGRYSSMNAFSLNDQVSSIRETGWSGGGGGSGGGNWGGSDGGNVGGSIVLFESPGLTGRSFTVSGPMPNMDGTGFNDRARSAMINGGTWQLCADADYMSSCEVLPPGRHDDLGSVTGRLSSLRPYGGGGPPPGGGGGGGGGWGGSSRVVLYERENFQGRGFTVDANVLNNLADAGFNDRASSLRVERGYWMFCTDANLGGECRTFGPGDYPQLGWFSNRISSGRRISNDYPYNAPPQWRN